jgi:hypothetical protein
VAWTVVREWTDKTLRYEVSRMCVMLLGKERWAGDEPEQGSERQTRRPASGAFDGWERRCETK